MDNIAIVGAGRVGLAFHRLVAALSIPGTFTLIDSQQVDVPGALVTSDLEKTLTELKPSVIICCTPFSVNVQVAQLAQRLGSHYMDFTEDNAVTEAIEQLDTRDVTFIPQTGLAPGLVSYMGHYLFKQLGTPKSLDLRVGALPAVSFGPGHYAITWSENGLINEYIKPAYRKVNGLEEMAKPLNDREELMVNGRLYEGFTTAGGVGNLAAYASVPNVEYKTLRHPGHLQVVLELLDATSWNFERAVELAKQKFQRTRDDVVVLVAHAVDETNNSASVGLHFYPDTALDLTALELTTAGTGVAVLELLQQGCLPKGTLLSSQVPFELLANTKAGARVFSHARA